MNSVRNNRGQKRPFHEFSTRLTSRQAAIANKTKQEAKKTNEIAMSQMSKSLSNSSDPIFNNSSNSSKGSHKKIRTESQKLNSSFELSPDNQVGINVPNFSAVENYAINILASLAEQNSHATKKSNNESEGLNAMSSTTEESLEKEISNGNVSKERLNYIIMVAPSDTTAAIAYMKLAELEPNTIIGIKEAIKLLEIANQLPQFKDAVIKRTLVLRLANLYKHLAQEIPSYLDSPHKNLQKAQDLLKNI